MQPVPKQRPEERRRHARVKLSLAGRFMLSDGREYPCETIDVSPGGIAITASVIGRAGERIVAYFDHIGRVEGTIVRQTAEGFAMEIAATSRKREKLADQLTWLANRQVLGIPEDRRNERSVPKNMRTHMVLPDGREYGCRVVDVSLSGAAVQSDVQPPINTLVALGRTSAKVVRHFDGGVGLEFIRPTNFDQTEDDQG
jgi:hypothetical protein